MCQYMANQHIVSLEGKSLPIIKLTKLINMKKILATLFSVLFVISANAQFASSGYQGSFGKTTETKRFVSYVKAGVSLNRFLFTESLGSNNSKVIVGYSAKYGFQYYVVENIGLYCGLEIGVGTRGYKYEEKNEKPSSNLCHAVKATPLQIGYKFFFTDKLALDAHVGCVLSYDFYTRREKGEFSANRFDVGINPGITLWYGRVGFDFTYQRGLLYLEDQSNLAPFFTFAESYILGLAYRF